MTFNQVVRGSNPRTLIVVRDMILERFRIMSLFLRINIDIRIKMRNIENGKQVIVPFHNKELKKGTEQGILKQAGIK